MTGDNKIMLTFFVLVLLTLTLYFITEFITERKKLKKHRKARYKAYRINRRATAQEYAKQLQLVYITTLYGGKK